MKCLKPYERAKNCKKKKIKKKYAYSQLGENQQFHCVLIKKIHDWIIFIGL